MNTDPNKIFLKNKAPKIVFGLGFAFIIANIVVNSIYIANSVDCVIYNWCSGYSYHYWECTRGGSVYCCDPSSTSSSSYTCGIYSDCFYEGSDYYTRCYGFSAFQWILGFGAIACLITLIVLYKQHKKRVLQAAVAGANNQVVFSDDPSGQYNQHNPGVFVQ